LFFLALTLWILDRDRRAPSPLVWILVALTAVWVNFHGGFVALLACIVLLALGSGIEARFKKDQALFRRYSLLSVACAAASLMNPYGIRLHVHIAKYLTSDWIRQAVDEFQSPKFRSENLLQFEALMFTALVIAGVLLMKKRIADVLPVLVWAHLALSSVRHVPIFVIVAAPFVASELTRVWDDWTQAASPRSALGILGTVARDLSGGFRRNSLWAPALAAAAIWLTPASKWPQDFPELKFPVDLTRQHAERLAVARVFTSDEWGDYLIYRGWPRQKVFIDGRSDFYGPKIGKEFLRLAHGLPDWEKILNQYDFDLALIPRDWPLATLLQRQPGWRLVAHDSQALLFERSPSFAGLINRAVTADRSRGDPEDEGQQSGFTPSFIASPSGDNSGLENTSGREESRKLADSVRAGPGRVRSSHGFCGRAVAEVAELDPGADKVAAVESNIVRGTHGP
jgi:hypothetical protein